MIRRSRTLARALAAVLALASGLAVVVLAAEACLPDLAAFPADDAALEAAPPVVGCGDGIIATLAGGADSGESCDPGPDAGNVPGCTACQVTCEQFLDLATGHCYFLAPAEGLYKRAHDRCKERGAHLVTFASAEEANLVTSKVLPSSSTSYWVGLEPSITSSAFTADRLEEPGFPYANNGPCEGCFGIAQADGGSFSIDSDAAAGECIASRDGRWYRVPCSGEVGQQTVCEREPVGVRSLDDCIIGAFCFAIPRTAADKSYLVPISAADPDQAADTCASLDGGSLAILESREEREQLAHELLARYPEIEQQLWLGLAQDDAGAWTWSDGVPAVPDAGRPLPWGNAQPDGGTAARAFMRLEGTSYDTQLAYADPGTRAARLFICQRPAR